MQQSPHKKPPLPAHSARACTASQQASVSAAEAVRLFAAGESVVTFPAPLSLISDLAPASPESTQARNGAVIWPTWGINTEYTPLNFPTETLRRTACGGDAASEAAAAAAFYGEHLLSRPSELVLADEDAAAAAEAAAGVTDTCDVALVLPWHCLERATGQLFPALRVRRFECAAECWSTSVRATGAAVNKALPLSWEPLVSVCQTRYSAIVDATVDSALWALPPGTVLLPEGMRRGDDAPTVDVLVYAPLGSDPRRMTSALSRRMWRGRVGPSGDWYTAGTRVAETPPPPAALLAVPAAAAKCALDVAFEPWRLPVQSELDLGGIRPESYGAELEAAAERARIALCMVELTGWLPAGAFAFAAPLSRFSAELVEKDLDATCDGALIALPVSPARVLAWLRDGDVRRGAVALADARGGFDAGSLRVRVHDATSSRAKWLAKLAQATANAHTVVFICNNSSSRSPERARDYVLWCKEQHQADGASSASLQTAPAQRVRVLAGGMAALVRLASHQPDIDMKELFTAYYLQYC